MIAAQVLHFGPQLLHGLNITRHAGGIGGRVLRRASEGLHAPRGDAKPPRKTRENIPALTPTLSRAERMLGRGG
jgi:hypothetical protein